MPRALLSSATLASARSEMLSETRPCVTVIVCISSSGGGAGDFSGGDAAADLVRIAFMLLASMLASVDVRSGRWSTNMRFN